MYRNRYFDFVRGLAIMMVVGIHTIPTIPIPLTDYGIFQITIRQILNCSVPIFLAISGYFIARKNLILKNDKIIFLKNQISKVYIPCLCFSVGWMALDMITAKTNPLIALAKLVFCGYSVYYFIALIIQFYLLTPILKRYNNIWGVIVAFVISAICVIIITYMKSIEGKSFPLIIYAGPFILWIVFFMMGIYFSTHNRNYSIWLPAAIITTGLIASVIESQIYYNNNGSGLGIKLSSFVYSTGIILLIFSSKVESYFSKHHMPRIIIFLGDISFAIYLIHMYVCTLIGLILPQYNSWIFKWSFTILGTVLVVLLIRIVAPKTISYKILGIKDIPPPTLHDHKTDHNG